MMQVPYTGAGYLDIEAVRSLTASTPFVFIVGARQCGKTYGVMTSILAHGERPVIVRRTKDERLKYANSQLTPLRPITRELVGVAAGDMVTLYRADPEASGGRSDDPAGWVLDLNSARKRGFALPPFQAVVYDEAIPEQHAGGRQDVAQAETFFNLLITLFANDDRFLTPQDHPKVWILANANSIDAGILSVFGITGTVERMLREGRSVYVSPQRALSVLLVDAPARQEIRQHMPIMRVVESSAVRDMVLSNRFIGDQTGVRGWPLHEFQALASFRDDYGGFTVWIHKHRPIIYVTSKAHPARHMLPNTKEAFLQLGKATAFKSRREFWYLVLHANSGVNAFYDSLRAKQWFRSMRHG